MKGLEPSTFCMASRRSSQLSYIRATRSIAAPGGTSGWLRARRAPRLYSSAMLAIAQLHA